MNFTLTPLSSHRFALLSITVDCSDGIIKGRLAGRTANTDKLLHLSRGNKVTSILDIHWLCRGGIDIIGEVITIAGIDGSAPTDIVTIGCTLDME